MTGRRKRSASRSPSEDRTKMPPMKRGRPSNQQRMTDLRRFMGNLQRVMEYQRMRRDQDRNAYLAEVDRLDAERLEEEQAIIRMEDQIRADMEQFLNNVHNPIRVSNFLRKYNYDMDQLEEYYDEVGDRSRRDLRDLRDEHNERMAQYNVTINRMKAEFDMYQVELNQLEGEWHND